MPRHSLNKKIHSTALHEAGHALACILLHRRLLHVRINRTHGLTGLTRCSQHPCLNPRRSHARAIKNIHREVIILFAGATAEELITGKRIMQGCAGDAQTIFQLLARITPDHSDQQTMATHAYQACAQLLRPHKKSIRAIAANLIEKGQLSGRQIKSIVLHNSPKTKGRTS